MQESIPWLPPPPDESVLLQNSVCYTSMVARESAVIPGLSYRFVGGREESRVLNGVWPFPPGLVQPQPPAVPIRFKFAFDRESDGDGGRLGLYQSWRKR